MDERIGSITHIRPPRNRKPNLHQIAFSPLRWPGFRKVRQQDAAPDLLDEFEPRSGISALASDI